MNAVQGILTGNNYLEKYWREEKLLPLSAQTKVYACECLATAYGCLYKDWRIPLWVSSIQRGGPVTTNGHGLIFTSHSHQKLQEKDRRKQKSHREE